MFQIPLFFLNTVFRFINSSCFNDFNFRRVRRRTFERWAREASSTCQRRRAQEEANIQNLLFERELRDGILKDMIAYQCNKDKDYEVMFSKAKSIYDGTLISVSLSYQLGQKNLDMFLDYRKKSLEMMEESVDQCSIDTKICFGMHQLFLNE